MLRLLLFFFYGSFLVFIFNIYLFLFLTHVMLTNCKAAIHFRKTIWHCVKLFTLFVTDKVGNSLNHHFIDVPRTRKTTHWMNLLRFEMTQVCGLSFLLPLVTHTPDLWPLTCSSMSTPCWLTYCRPFLPRLMVRWWACFLAGVSGVFRFESADRVCHWTRHHSPFYEACAVVLFMSVSQWASASLSSSSSSSLPVTAAYSSRTRPPA